MKKKQVSQNYIIHFIQIKTSFFVTLVDGRRINETFVVLSVITPPNTHLHTPSGPMSVLQVTPTLRRYCFFKGVLAQRDSICTPSNLDSHNSAFLCLPVFPQTTHGEVCKLDLRLLITRFVFAQALVMFLIQRHIFILHYLLAGFVHT